MAIISKKINPGKKAFPSSEIKETLSRIFQGLEKLDPKKITVFVHGSFADDTLTDFSDLDDLIIIDDDYLDEAQPVLDAIELRFQLRDPLQHHGHWLIKRSQLGNYDMSYMPLFIIEDAILIYGQNEFEIKYDDQLFISNNIRRLRNTCVNILKLNKGYQEHQLNIYELKRFVGSVTLIPPLLFQIFGEEIGKRQSIERIPELLKNREMIEWASTIRENWGKLFTHQFDVFKSGLKNYSSAKEWRINAQVNSPVMDYQKIFGETISTETVNSYVNEIIYKLDQLSIRNYSVNDYQNATELIINKSAELGAVLSGNFGEVKSPSISDLDIFISFSDEQYKKGCSEIENLIKSDSDLSYLFTHSPMFVKKSMLDDIKYLHTLTGLEIIYKPENITLNTKTSESYTGFQKRIWHILINRTAGRISSDFMKFDLRTILLSLKNLQTSVYNLELNLYGNSSELEKNKEFREKIIKEGVTVETRNLIEKEYTDAFKKFKDLIDKTDFGYNSNHFLFLLFQKYMNYNRDGLPFDYFKFLIVFKKTKEAKEFNQAFKKYYKIHLKTGGYFNHYICPVPVDQIIKNPYILVFKIMASRIKRKLLK